MVIVIEFPVNSLVPLFILTDSKLELLNDTVLLVPVIESVASPVILRVLLPVAFTVFVPDIFATFVVIVVSPE